MRYFTILLFLMISITMDAQKTLRPNINPDAMMLKKWIKNDTLYLDCDCHITDMAIRNGDFRLYYNVDGKSGKVPLDELPTGRSFVLVAIGKRYIAFNIETDEEIKI